MKNRELKNKIEICTQILEFNKKKYEYRIKIWWENKLKTLTQKLEQQTKNLINFNGK